VILIANVATLNGNVDGSMMNAMAVDLILQFVGKEGMMDCLIDCE
jgi:hypothetical protein